MEHTAKIIHSTQWHTQVPQDAVRRRQMEMEVRDDIFAEIRLPALKLEVAHLRLHDNRLRGSLRINLGCVHGLEDLDRLGNAGTELGDNVLNAEGADAEKFGGVGHGLDLVRKAVWSCMVRHNPRHNTEIYKTG
jgi:hypothetical protein